MDEHRYAYLLVRWYQAGKRDLPWRDVGDPYAVWISEIMLQQTRVEAVIGYYLRFMEHFPTVRALAEAREDTVLKLWEGLGYYSRARNLHKAAKRIVQEWDGVFPVTYEEIRTLPGIGEYTAGAILSIAYNQPYPAVDGNVLRVIARLQAMREDVMSHKVRGTITEFVRASIPEGYAGDFTQSLMDLGAGICIPRYPRCGECPIRSECKGYAEGNAAQLPVKKKKAQPVKVMRRVYIVRNENRVLLTRREDKGVLAGLYEFPGVDVAEQDPRILWRERYGVMLKDEAYCFSYVHVFSHIEWNIEVWSASYVSGHAPVWMEERYAEPDALDTLMLPSAFRRIVGYLQSGSEGGRG